MFARLVRDQNLRKRPAGTGWGDGALRKRRAFGAAAKPKRPLADGGIKVVQSGPSAGGAGAELGVVRPSTKLQNIRRSLLFPVLHFFGPCAPALTSTEANQPVQVPARTDL